MRLVSSLHSSHPVQERFALLNGLLLRVGVEVVTVQRRDGAVRVQGDVV